MFSEKAKKLMKSTAENVHFWSCGPVKWNEEEDRVESESRIFRQFLWLANFLLISAHWIFLLARYIQYNFLYESASLELKVYTEYAAIAYSFPVAIHVYMYLREQDLVSFLNNYMQFYCGLSGEHLQSTCST